MVHLGRCVCAHIPFRSKRELWNLKGKKLLEVLYSTWRKLFWQILIGFCIEREREREREREMKKQFSVDPFILRNVPLQVHAILSSY
jgi:hypothetical protein